MGGGGQGQLEGGGWERCGVMRGMWGNERYRGRRRGGERMRGWEEGEPGLGRRRRVALERGRGAGREEGYWEGKGKCE